MSDVPIAGAPVTHIQVDALPGGDGIVEVNTGTPTPDQAGAIGATGVAPSVEKPQAPSRSFMSKLLHRGPKNPPTMGEDGSGPYKN